MNANEIISNVSKILDDHIQKSREKKTPTLKQQDPIVVAKKLNLKEFLKNGFNSSSDIYDFVLKYLFGMMFSILVTWVIPRLLTLLRLASLQDYKLR